jgi:PhnB protein
MAVKPIPEGYHSLTPYLYFERTRDAIEFYKAAFGATERGVMDGPGGAVMHAELQIGDSVVMMADNADQAPSKLGGTAVSILIYTEDVDAMFKRAVDKGATSLDAPSDKFYGDRMGSLRDPFGHEWTIGTHIEDVSEEQMQERMASMAPGG